MKRIQIFLLSAMMLGITNVGLAQELTFNTITNQIGTPYIEIQIGFGNDSTLTIDPVKFGTTFDYSIKADGKGVFNNPTYTFSLSNTLNLRIGGLTSADFTAFSSSDLSAYVDLAKDLAISWSDGSSTNFTATEFRQSTLGKLAFNDRDQELYLAAYGGKEFAFASNYFNAGVTPKSEADGNSAVYSADFSYRKNYWLFKNPNFAFYTKGRVSTDSRDSLNYVYLYPVNIYLGPASTHSSRKSDFLLQAGVEGNQRFTNARGTLNLKYQTIIDNLVDLTFGNNRFRIKPVISLGAKLYSEFDNIRTAEQSNETNVQLFGEMYYYIPIADIYSLTLEGNAFYDFSSVRNPEEEIKLTYSVTFGIEIPNTPFKTVFKYTNGQVDVNNLQDTFLSLGILGDLQSLLSKIEGN